jgi:chromosome segregation ATPase
MDDKGNLKGQLSEIELSIVVLDQKIERHMDMSGKSHESISMDLSALERKQERFEEKLDSFFDSVSNLKDELSKMNVNMATYNAQLAEHMRRTEASESRLEKMEEISKILIQKDASHDAELSKLKVTWSTIVKVFVGMAGAISLVWTVMQLLEKIYR